MPEILGADWSFAHIDPAALRAAGYTHAFRYLAPLPNAKVITRAEYQADQKAGLTVHLNFEQAADQAMGGFQQGYKDGLVVRQLRKDLGASLAGKTIYSFDTDDRAHPGWENAVDQYLKGAESVSGHVEGIYGSSRVIEEMKRRAPGRETWQTQAWSGDYVSPQADYYQRTGHTHMVPGVNNSEYDEDVVIHVPVKPIPGVQVPDQLNPHPVIVSLTEFEHETLGHCAAAVTPDGAVFCSPAGAYRGGANHGASAGPSFADTGRRAALIRRPNPKEVARGQHFGYVIEDGAGETYHFG